MSENTLTAHARLRAEYADNLAKNQLEGIDFMVERLKKMGSVLNADNMGLGKTLQVLCALRLIAAEQRRKRLDELESKFAPSHDLGCKSTGTKEYVPYNCKHSFTTLILSDSVSSLSGWCQEEGQYFQEPMNRLMYMPPPAGGKRDHEWCSWTGGARGSICTERISTRELTKARLAKYGYVLAPYHILGRARFKTALGMTFGALVFDEVHHFRSHIGLAYIKTIFQGCGPDVLRIAVSATPIVNRLQDMHGLYETILGAKDVPKELTPQAHKELWDRYAWRSTKMGACPPIDSKRVKLMEHTDKIPSDLYCHVRYLDRPPNTVEMQGGKGGQDLGNLERACLQLAMPVSKDDPRINAIDEYIRTECKAHEKIVIFCDFVEPVERIAKMLKAKGHRCATIVGLGATSAVGDSYEVRRRTIADFQELESDVRVLLATFCVSTSVTLTAGSHVLFIGARWNYACDAQATYRCYRFGTRSPTVEWVYFLYRDSIESRLFEITNDRRDLLDKINADSNYKASVEDGKLIQYVLTGEKN